MSIEQPPTKKRRGLRVLASVVSIAILAATGAAAFAGYYYNQLNITADSALNWTKTSGPKPGDPINILLMGSDTREGKNAKGHGNAVDIAGARSDTTILLHISGDRTRATAVSIPRDSKVQLPYCKNKQGQTVGGYTSRINEAFDMGGPSCTVKAVEELSGVPIDHYAVVDFVGFKKVVDALDGVEVCLEKPVNDPKSKLKLPAGKSIVKGEQALAFVRARYALSDGSDLSRIDRQQDFLSSAMRKAISLDTITNPAKLYEVIQAVTGTLTTDPTLATMDAMKDLALDVSELRPEDVTFATVPIDYNDDGGTVSWNSHADALWEAIKNDQPWPPASAKKKKKKNGTSATPSEADIAAEQSKARDATKLICAK